MSSKRRYVSLDKYASRGRWGSTVHESRSTFECARRHMSITGVVTEPRFSRVWLRYSPRRQSAMVIIMRDATAMNPKLAATAVAP